MLLKKLKEIRKKLEIPDNYEPIIDPIIISLEKEIEFEDSELQEYQEAIFLERWIYYLIKNLEILEQNIKEKEDSEKNELKYNDFFKTKNELEKLLEYQENIFIDGGLHYLSVKIGRIDDKISDNTASEAEKSKHKQYTEIRKYLQQLIRERK